MSQVRAAAGWDGDEVQLACTAAPNLYLVCTPVMAGPLRGASEGGEKCGRIVMGRGKGVMEGGKGDLGGGVMGERRMGGIRRNGGGSTVMGDGEEKEGEAVLE